MSLSVIPRVGLRRQWRRGGSPRPEVNSRGLGLGVTMEPGPSVLEVLLDAAPEWRDAEGLSRPKATGSYEALCGLWRPAEAEGGGLCFTGRCRDAGRFCRRTVAAPAGEFTDFVWETTEHLQTSSNSGRLLAVSNHNDLGIYEFHVQDGICDVTNTHSCSEEALRKLVENKNLSLSSSLTMKILSFKSSTSFILLDNCTLLHLSWLEGASEADILDGFKLLLPLEAAERIADGQICQEMLFLLDSAGWIYICDTVDGKQLGKVNLALCRPGVFEEAGDPCDLTCLSRLELSPDLDVAVAVNPFNCAICVSLNNFFREHPDHLQRTSEGSNDESLRAPAGIDEDDLASSVYSDKVLNLPFQTDRSWTARLGAFYNKTKVPLAEKFLTRFSTPWYHNLSSRNSNVASCYTSSCKSNTSGQKGDVNSQESKWHRILQLQGFKESMSIETVSVSGFSVLFTLVAPDSGALTIAFWDLETEEVTYHHIDGHSLPVEGGGEDELCLFLTDAGLSMVVFGFSQEDLLNRLMIYGKAGIVDSLCHRNNWNRCSIPIHALEAGLENRQLDTVDFFPEEQRNLLFYAPAGFFKAGNSGAALTSWAQLKNVEEIKPALDLLCSAIKEHDSETQSRQFSEQLLTLTMTFSTNKCRNF
ncbi:spatacsin-like [Pristis pectinata]|uniref:spatacsin-like n=1 Tax=Pristis pectinata TaxID=685728 RepID=UPI00223D03D2|nr:spatacsin-like [Pristis pectinata]